MLLLLLLLLLLRKGLTGAQRRLYRPAE